ncbi:hypothetical protein GJ496_002655 [Pomphorhynchus laevis]|nr:hypothetical protein GJ496_002655 [Pomphorhynchus laevis]
MDELYKQAGVEGLTEEAHDALMLTIGTFGRSLLQEARLGADYLGQSAITAFDIIGNLCINCEFGMCTNLCYISSMQAGLLIPKRF